MRELHDSVVYNKLKFEYVGPNKDVRFYQYMDSKEHFNEVKHDQVKFIEVKNKQNEFLDKLSNKKIGRKSVKQKEVINNLERFCIFRAEVMNFFWDYIEMFSDANCNAKKKKKKNWN